jgi:hypothetical protein
MSRLRGRAVVLSACVAGLVVVGSKPAVADAVALVPNKAWAYYDTLTNTFRVHDLFCNGSLSYGNYRWTGFPNDIESVVDPNECDDRVKNVVLHPPRRATGIKIRACQDDSGPNTCSDWVRTDK